MRKSITCRLMHPVSGLERPWIQWTFVALGVLLIALVAAEAIAIRRTREALQTARVAEMNARLDRQQLDIQLGRERSAREALAFDAARLRGSAASSASTPPTLTLTPLGKRGPTPPAPSVETPARELVIELRLTLPRNVPRGLHDFTIAIRHWSTGEAVWTRSGIASAAADDPAAVTAFVTGDALAAGAYEILLTAVNASGQPAEVATYEVAIAPQKH